MSQYHAFQLYKHDDIFSFFLYINWLYQEYYINAWICIEVNCLQWVWINQSILWTEYYNEFQDVIEIEIEKDI